MAKKIVKTDKVEYKEITKAFVDLISKDPYIISNIELGIWNNETGEFDLVTSDTIKYLNRFKEDLKSLLNMKDLMDTQLTLMAMPDLLKKDKKIREGVAKTVEAIRQECSRLESALYDNIYVKNKELA